MTGARPGERLEVVLPARHALATGATGALLLPVSRLAPLLPGGWRPATLLAGWSVLAVAYHDFSGSPVGPYRQLSLAVPVHVGPAGRAVRGWPLLPIAWQSLGGRAELFPYFGLCVVLLVATTPEAVAYSREIWGEPAAWGQVEAVPGSLRELRGRAEAGPVSGAAGAAGGGGWGTVLLARAEQDGTQVGVTLPVLLPAPEGRLPGWEERRYRLFSFLGGAVLTDHMHVRVPCRRLLRPRRVGLRWTAGDRAVMEGRPWCLMATAYGSGEIVFPGPVRLDSGGQARTVGRRQEGG